MPTPLTNDRWGYESNCFVCEAGNAGGLRIPFCLDDDGITVSAEFMLDSTYSGAPALVHGGVSLAILDEAQAWACIAVAGVWALTTATAATFPGAVFVDHPHRVEATATESTPETIATEGRILDADGHVLVRSESRFTVVGTADVASGTDALTGRLRDRLVGKDEAS